MKANENKLITVETIINVPIENVWKYWTDPRYIIQWNNASEDWHTTFAENDLQVNGKFLSRMEAKDGSWGFDFSGTYTFIDHQKQINYVLDDGRKVEVSFKTDQHQTVVTEIFEPENEFSPELQKAGWQSILDNFKKFAEGNTDILRFEIAIDAPAEKVYQTMLGDKTYREWTAIFNPGSYYKGTWEKRTSMLFVGTGENGEEGGMVSRIRENIYPKFVSIEHIGILKNHEEILEGPGVDQWKGALENYTFLEDDGKTKLIVDISGVGGYAGYFDETWPKALQVLKNICER